MSEGPHYHINVFWYPPAQCWVADVPDLRPCSAEGASAGEAVVRVEGVIAAWIAAAEAADLPVPAPCYSPALYAAA